MKNMIPALLAAILVPCGAMSQTEEVRTMPFQDCIATIQTVSGQLGTAPINIVETSELRIVRFVTVDGNVLVTCSRPDRKMIVRMSK